MLDDAFITHERDDKKIIIDDPRRQDEFDLIFFHVQQMNDLKSDTKIHFFSLALALASFASMV